MKKSAYLLAPGIALGLAVTPALAQQTRSTVPFIDYVGAGLVISDVDDFDEGTALVLNAGKELQSIKGLGIEGEFTTTLTESEADVGPASAEFSYWTMAGYGVYRFPLSQQFDLRGRLGLLYASTSVDSNIAGGDEDDDEFNISAGVGADFNLTNRFAITADYTYVDSDINHYGLGVKFNF